MIRITLRRILTGCLLVTVFFVQGCTDKPASREDEIRQYIEKGVEAAEDRSAGDLAELIHVDYRDEKQLNKELVTKLARLYFFRHKNIHLFTKIREIKFYSESRASVTVYVAMAGSVIADVSVLSSLRARVYRFDLDLVKQDAWLLEQASWQAANMADIE